MRSGFSLTRTIGVIWRFFLEKGLGSRETFECDAIELLLWSLAMQESMTSNRLDFVHVNMCVIIIIPYLCMDLRLRGRVTMLSRQAPPGGFVGW